MTHGPCKKVKGVVIVREYSVLVDWLLIALPLLTESVGGYITVCDAWLLQC